MRCLWLCDKNFARVADLTFMRNSHDEMGCDEDVYKRQLSSFGHDVTRNVYVVVLRKDLPSPIAPESDEEKPDAAKPDQSDAKKKEDAAAKPENEDNKGNKDSKEAKDKAKPEEPVKVTIDLSLIHILVLVLLDRGPQRRQHFVGALLIARSRTPHRSHAHVRSHFHVHVRHLLIGSHSRLRRRS